MSVEVTTVDMAAPDDVEALSVALDALGPVRRLALLAKLEAQPGHEDAARLAARRAIERLLEIRGLAKRTLVLLAVGCEGIATPFAQLIVERPTDGGVDTKVPRLAFGLARSALVPRGEHGTRALVDRVADTVRQALADGALAPTQVALALVKCPVAPAGIVDATDDQRALPRGRAIAALGAGIALGEIAPTRVSETAIARDVDLFARRAMTFAGPELERVEAVVLGNRPGSGGLLQAVSVQLADILDGAGIRRMLDAVGVQLDRWGELVDPGAVPALLLKAGVARDGYVRGGRTTVFSGGQPPDWHMRAAASGMVGALLGHTRCFVSGDPIQQARPGGAIAAAIVRVGDDGRR